MFFFKFTEFPLKKKKNVKIGQLEAKIWSPVFFICSIPNVISFVWFLNFECVTEVMLFFFQHITNDKKKV